MAALVIGGAVDAAGVKSLAENMTSMILSFTNRPSEAVQLRCLELLGKACIVENVTVAECTFNTYGDTK